MKPTFTPVEPSTPKPVMYCSWCKQPILEGEVTIKDEFDNDAHLACEAPTEGQEGYIA